MSKHRHVGITPIVLATGRPLAPGDTITNLDTNHPDNQAHITAGTLLELPARREPKETTR